MKQFFLFLAAVLCAVGAQAASEKKLMHTNYGLVVYQTENSCSPNRIYVDVATPHILISIHESQAWSRFLTFAIRGLNDRCQVKLNRPLASQLVVVQGDIELATASIDYDGSRWGKGGRKELELINFAFKFDRAQVTPTDIPSERHWAGTLMLTPKTEAELIARDTGEDYFALAYKVTQIAVDKYMESVLGMEKDAAISDVMDMFGVTDETDLAKRGVLIPVLGSTSFGPVESFEPMVGANLEYLNASAARGYIPALRVLAKPLMQKMQAMDRSTRRLTYKPDNLSPDERDHLLLYTAKIYLMDPATGAPDGRLLTELGFEVQRAVDVVEKFGLSATISHLREAPTTDRVPTRYEMARAFGKTLISEQCNPLKAFAETGSLSSLVIRSEGNACVWTDPAGFGYSLRLSVDQVFTPNCTGADHSYTCVFKYNLYCSTSGVAAGGAFQATYCLPFTLARQPAQARFVRTSDGWRAQDFVFLK